MANLIVKKIVDKCVDVVEDIRIKHKVSELQKPTPSLEARLQEHKVWLDSFGEQGRRLDVSNMDLQGTDFSNYDLSFMIAKNTGFQRCNFTKASLLCADLEFAKLYRSNFKDTILVGANLRSSFSRCTSFTDSVIRESDVRIFHQDLMGPQRTFWNFINIASILTSVTVIYPVASEMLGSTGAIIGSAAIVGALASRPVWEFIRGGWIYQPVKNMKEVLWNKKTPQIETIEKQAAFFLERNKELKDFKFPVSSEENLKLNRELKEEKNQKARKDVCFGKNK